MNSESLKYFKNIKFYSTPLGIDVLNKEQYYEDDELNELINEKIKKYEYDKYSIK